MRLLLRILFVALALLAPTALIGAPAAAADTPAGNSAVTKSGTGDFAGLQVTVSQTQGLIDQTLSVSWKGGVATPSAINGNGGPLGNFLQIMQCWGDDPAGPDRTQCQFGVTGVATVYGFGGRFLTEDPGGLTDPLETIPKVGSSIYFPFWPVGSTKPTTASDQYDPAYFDLQSTNEIPVARTHPDGTGFVNFEAQTRDQAPGLGCGAPITANGVTTGQSCWLVVVPRDTKEVDGTVPSSANGLQSSALSQTNWNKRIVFPLGFLPLGQHCAIGAAERQISGDEVPVEAVSRWQPTLCATAGGAAYNYTQLTDDVARTKLLSDQPPDLGVLTNPVPPDQAAGHSLVYAPIVHSALVIGFSVVRNPLLEPGSDDPRVATDGSAFTGMKLNPRLVAKLLTQSYRGAQTPPNFGYVFNTPNLVLPATNPASLNTDKEFLALNPEYADELATNIYIELFVPEGTYDVAGVLWQWVLGDPDARAFVDGTPDPNGMVVNPANKGLQLPLPSFPRKDAVCASYPATDGTHSENVSFCSSDAHLYANNLHDAARSAGRGDRLALDPQHTSFTADGSSYSFPKLPRLQPDEEAEMAVTDLATAERYGLQVASLQNYSSKNTFVLPDEAGLTAGLAAMKPSAVPGVLTPDPTSTNPAAYPLTTLSYAVADTNTLTAASAKDDAAFLRYAAGPGQVPGLLPGQLPPGNVPLSATLKAQTLAAATTIETKFGTQATATPTPAPTAAPAVTGSGTQTGSGPAGSGTLVGSGPQADGTTVDPAADAALAAAVGAGPAAGAAAPNDSGSAGPAAPGGAAAAAPLAGGAPASGPAPVVAAPAASAAAPAAAPAAAVAGGPAITGTTNVAQTRPTPALPAPAIGALLVALLIGGGLAAVAAPATHLLSNRTDPAGGGGVAADRTATGQWFAWLTARPALSARRR